MRPRLDRPLAPLLLLGATNVLGGTACTLEPQEVPTAQPTRVEDPLIYADPRVGSGGFGFANGSAFPGAAAPFGLAKVGPDTRGPYDTINFLHYSGYWAGDDQVRAFSHLHLHGTGATDYGVLGVMPIDAFEASRFSAPGYESHFDKATETASPGYYAVTLDRGTIRSELTATRHAAHHRHGYPAGTKEGHVVFDLDHHLSGGEVTQAEFTLEPEAQRIRGKLHHVGGMSGGFGGYDVFFDARTRAPWKVAQVWSNGDAPAEGTSGNGTKVGFALSFDLGADGAVELKVGLSFVSLENATKNLEAEIPDWDFDDTRAKTAAAWSDLLGRMKLWGGTETERRIFYSSLYRAFLMPTASSDVDGSYLYGGEQHTADGFSFLTDQSLWDTYRTVTPFYSLVAPEAARDTVRSLHAMAEISGFFPKWPIATGEAGTMIGASADVVLADSYIKGVTDFDAEDAYMIARRAAVDPVEPSGGRGGRGDVVPYMEYGYVPASVGRSVSHTLEYAHDDLALGLLAKALGKTDDAALFADRANNHRNLFDPVTGFIRAKDEGRTFVESPYNPYSISDHYAEANGWHSLWAQHDIPGIAELLGGQAPFVEKLQRFLEESVADLEERPIEDNFASAAPRNAYWHGNEPDIHAAYAFAQIGRADLTQKYVRWVARAHYTDKPGGLAGNDDGGTLSCWYLFTAAGFYPIPGTDRYILGTPFFPRMEIAVKAGTIIVEAPAVSAENIYVQAVTWNGQALDKPEILHGDLAQGGTLRFEMGPAPGSFGVTKP
ncbi:MAG TPA: GH92 family glycosyl hydrolase [Polyangium sp.]|nr:GH92 family glycosyl hydrolase [Polyangium sp.]